MNRTALVLVGIAAALLVLVPPAQAQDGAAETTEVDFFGHVFGFGSGQPMPANVEYPVGEANLGLGPGYTCTSHFDDDGDTAAGEGVDPDSSCREGDPNRLYLFSTAGFVDVGDRAEFFNEGGYSQLHNERGQAKPILLDTSGEISTRIFISVDFHGWFVGLGDTYCLHPHPENAPCAYPYWGWDPGYRQDFVVEATLYHGQLGEYQGEAGRQPPVDDAVRSGDVEVVAEGQFGPEPVATGLPGAPHAAEIEIDLGSPQVEEIPKTHDVFMEYKLFNERSGEEYSTGDFRFWAGEFFPPRFTLPVRNAFAVESVIPSFVHDKLVLLGVMSSPWGSYDIDPDATTLTVTHTGTGDEVVPESVEVFSDYSVAHGGHFDPANVTYIWDYREDGLEPGTYEATIEAENFQNTVRASCTGTFTVGPDGQPGETEAGTCGFQSLEEEQRKELEEEAGEQAGEDGTELGAPEPLPEAGAAGLAGLALVTAGPVVRRR